LIPLKIGKKRRRQILLESDVDYKHYIRQNTQRTIMASAAAAEATPVGASRNEGRREPELGAMGGQDDSGPAEAEAEPVAGAAAAGTSASDQQEKDKEEEDARGAFECNICLDVAKDAVISMCGHLFCWPCLHQWLETR